MARILLVDTNISSLPIYDYLNDAGNEIYVVGNNPNDVLAKCVPNYIQADYSDVDSLRTVIDQLKIDFLVPGCNDASYKACALVNEAGRFPGIETPENCEVLNNKQKFRVFAKQHGLPVPRVYDRDEIDSSSYPLIVKPVDSFSGRGVTIVNYDDNESLDEAICNAQKLSKDGKCVIEEFVVGQLYSHSAFIAGGEICSDVVVEEYCIAYPYAVDTSRVTTKISDQVLKNIRDAIHVIAKELGLKDGLMHTQFMSNGTSVWIIEPTRRCPGDLYSRLIDMSTCINYAENYTRPFLGMSFNLTGAVGIRSFIVRHTLTNRDGGQFITMRFNEAIKVREFVPLSLAGDKIPQAPAGRIGILFLEACTVGDQESIVTRVITRRLYEDIRIRV